jgi:hypothetical protein
MPISADPKIAARIANEAFRYQYFVVAHISFYSAFQPSPVMAASSRENQMTQEGRRNQPASPFVSIGPTFRFWPEAAPGC